MSPVKQITSDERLENVENNLGNFIVETNKHFDKIESRLDSVKSRLDGVESRLSKVETHLVDIDNKLDNLSNKIDKLTDVVIDRFESQDRNIHQLQALHNISQV